MKAIYRKSEQEYRSFIRRHYDGLAGKLTGFTGFNVTTGTINLSGASSFSNAAALIEAALTAVGCYATVEYGSQLNAFVITSPTTGTASTIT